MPNNILDAMNNTATLSRPVFIRLNTVGDVVGVAVALHYNAMAAEKHDELGIAARMRSLSDQLMANTPDDWDCGDPTCEDCRERREARKSGDGLKRAGVFEPDVRFIVDPKAGEA